ncbi:MAG TPA: tetratricopeptide repeat protein, partial [Burkholderiales bacterium]|nr:tetratricopeptide repeat protein [Burkholderiales bacterium]
MLRKPILGLALAASLTLTGGYAVAAEPTIHQVYQAADAGNYREAQAMMDQVLRDHPNSAKAHFVEAELLAR